MNDSLSFSYSASGGLSNEENVKQSSGICCYKKNSKEEEEEFNVREASLNILRNAYGSDEDLTELLDNDNVNKKVESRFCCGKAKDNDKNEEIIANNYSIDKNNTTEVVKSNTLAEDNNIEGYDDSGNPNAITETEEAQKKAEETEKCLCWKSSKKVNTSEIIIDENDNKSMENALEDHTKSKDLTEIEKEKSTKNILLNLYCCSKAADNLREEEIEIQDLADINDTSKNNEETNKGLVSVTPTADNILVSEKPDEVPAVSPEESEALNLKLFEESEGFLDEQKKYENYTARFPDESEETRRRWSDTQGCYLTYDQVLNRFTLIWSNKAIAKAIGFFGCPPETLPVNKIRLNERVPINERGTINTVARAAWLTFAKQAARYDGEIVFLTSELWTTGGFGNIDLIFLQEDGSLAICRKGNKPYQVSGPIAIAAVENSFRFQPKRKGLMPKWTRISFATTAKSLSQSLYTEIDNRLRIMNKKEANDTKAE